jgi:hypothetical protein
MGGARHTHGTCVHGTDPRQTELSWGPGLFGTSSLTFGKGGVVTSHTEGIW